MLKHLTNHASLCHMIPWCLVYYFYIWNFFIVGQIHFLGVWIDSMDLESYHQKPMTFGGSIHEFMNRITCESIQNLVSRIKKSLWIGWTVSYEIESYQPSSWVIWIDSNLVWFVSIFIVQLTCNFVVWINSHIKWINWLYCFWPKYCTCHPFLYILTCS